MGLLRGPHTKRKEVRPQEDLGLITVDLAPVPPPENSEEEKDLSDQVAEETADLREENKE